VPRHSSGHASADGAYRSPPCEALTSLIWYDRLRPDFYGPRANQHSRKVRRVSNRKHEYGARLIREGALGEGADPQRRQDPLDRSPTVPSTLLAFPRSRFCREKVRIPTPYTTFSMSGRREYRAGNRKGAPRCPRPSLTEPAQMRNAVPPHAGEDRVPLCGDRRGQGCSARPARRR
jgi:hypothetical protein